MQKERRAVRVLDRFDCDGAEDDLLTALAAIQLNDAAIVPGVLEDSRFAENRFLTEHSAPIYSALPLNTREGAPLKNITMIDTTSQHDFPAKHCAYTGVQTDAVITVADCRRYDTGLERQR